MATDNGHYFGDIYAAARGSDDFRRVLGTADHVQLVIMTLAPGEEIGEEVHPGNDQVLLAVEGSGVSVLEGERRSFEAGYLVLVPQGTRHNFINTGDGPLRLVTLYGPPDHRPGTVHKTKADAERDSEDHP
jgi:mannose-6-phosphate isomerase-like protein (cupin superfamily)